MTGTMRFPVTRQSPGGILWQRAGWVFIANPLSDWYVRRGSAL